MFKEKIARLYFLFSYSRQETGSGQFHFLIVKRVGVMCGSNIQAGGKNINEILRLKENNSWPRVEYLTGITPNDIKAARDRNDARYFAAALDLKERDILPYLRQNYALNDVLHAALLAQASGSTAESILAAHRPPTHDWSYVAYELDVSREKLDAIREKIASVK